MKYVITGANRGLGRAIAESLVEKGNVVVGCSRSPFNSDKFEYIKDFNLMDPASFALVEEHLKDADGLINNAAIAFDGLLATQGEQMITDVIQTNLTSVLLLNKKYVRERLKNRKAGNILNISSIISIRGYSGLAAYSASKAGLDGMTRSLARELGSRGFRINSILPGYMETDMSKALSIRDKDKIIRRTPLARLATLDDIVPVIEFLLSDSAKFITGQSIVVDGGITV